MKPIKYIFILLLFSSCVSSQKKLQRRIEKNGIKESIKFVQDKYPEYFKKKDTVIHDTIVFTDTIIVAGDTLDVVLSDSNNTLTFNNDSVSISIDKTSKEAKIIWKEKRVPYYKTIYKETICPEVNCPDCEDLQDNTKEPDGNKFTLWMLIILEALFIGFLLTRKK